MHEIQIKEFFSYDNNDKNEEIYKSKREKILSFSKHKSKRKINLKIKANYSNNLILLYKYKIQKKVLYIKVLIKDVKGKIY